MRVADPVGVCSLRIDRTEIVIVPLPERHGGVVESGLVYEHG
jgi:hypothetical protein